MVRSDGQARHRVHPERQPQRVSPAGPPAQVDDRGVGHQPGQVAVEQGKVSRARRGHGDRPVELVTDAAAQREPGQADHDGRRHAGGHRLGQPPGLAADKLPDREGHWQQHQDQDGQDAERGHHLAGQPAARVHDVGLHAVGGGLGQQAGRDQHGYPEPGGRAAQQVTGAADPAGRVILDDHRSGQGGPGTIRPGPSGPAPSGPAPSGPAPPGPAPPGPGRASPGPGRPPGTGVPGGRGVGSGVVT